MSNVLPSCPFCALPEQRILHATERSFVFRDYYPVSPGHTLIVPKRHVASLFETTRDERIDLMGMLDWARESLVSERPDGYNIGINDGAAAGQTIPHLHIHLIPRYRGDKEEPRGGVRWILPEKADYWSKR